MCLKFETYVINHDTSVTLSIANDVRRRVDVVAETSDDEAVQLRVPRGQNVEADDLSLREGWIATDKNQHR